jgi:hypothetical protein
MYTDPMRQPTEDEIATFAYVREYLRWRTAPEKDLGESDDLFKAGIAKVEFGAQESLKPWYLYVAGYFQAARALLEGPHDKFFLQFAIYPVVFLYRHYLELEIKGVMMATAELLKKPLPDFGNDHAILSLWSKFKQMLPAEHEAFREAPNIERLLKQINDIDPKSMDTRYGLRRDLKSRSLPKVLEFDVYNFRDTMDKLEAQLRIFGHDH